MLLDLEYLVNLNFAFIESQPTAILRRRTMPTIYA
jgi:hypothetical protein